MKPTPKALTLSAAIIGGAVMVGAAFAQFASTENMIAARSGHAAARLADGRVLLSGGSGPIGDGFFGFHRTAEIYDPVSRRFDETGEMTTARNAHTLTLLPDGTVLAAGGFFGFSTPLAGSEVYDPETGDFTVTGSMTSSRAQHTATRLPDGRVLMAGGLTASSLLAMASAELYTPDDLTFTSTGTMALPRFGHTATALSNGLVLVAGGSTALGTFNTATAELFDPATGTFSAAGAMSVPRARHTATPLSDGRVLVVGGVGVGTETLATAEIYDPATNAFAPTGALIAARSDHTASLLSSGQVLVAGGDAVVAGTHVGLASGELYDPVSGQFTAAGDMTTERRGHTATALVGGGALVAGGGDPNSAETFGAAAPDVTQGNHDGYEGFSGLTGTVPCAAAGWAFNPARPDSDVTVRLLVDGAAVTTTLASGFRQDLLDAGIGDGTVAFDVPLGLFVTSAVEHEIRAQALDVASGEWVELGTSKRLTCTELWGTHDAHQGIVPKPECLATGWAFDGQTPETRVQVRVKVDGKVVAETTADDFREDVRDAGFGDGFSGWTVRLFGRIKPGNESVVTAEARDTEAKRLWFPLSDTEKRLTCVA